MPMAPSIEHFDLAFAGNDVAPLLHAADGSAIGGWRAIGQGRLGVLPIADSYALVLAGHADAHAELWNAVLATMARPVPASPLRQLPAWTWAGERSALCGLPTGSEAIAPDGTRSSLLPDPHANQCSGWWPQEAGWHRIVAGDDSAGVLVIDPADARALHAQATRNATQALHASADTGHRATRPMPGPRWPWLLGFVLVASLLWWLERHPMPSGNPHALGKA